MRMFRRFMLLMMSSMLVASVGLYAGCPSSIGGDTIADPNQSDASVDKPAIPGLTSLSITPANATLTADTTSAPPKQSYRAVGRFADNAERDVSTEVNWKVDNTAIGNVDASGVFTASNQAGGQGVITASSGATSATAQITVIFKPVIKTATAPANAETLIPTNSAGTVMNGNSPVIVYPSHNTTFPRNIYKVLFQWNQGTGNNLFRLEFKSPTMTLSVYTTGDRWEPTAEQWGFMANSNAGGKVTWTVYGVNTASPAVVYRSDPGVDIAFSKNAVQGAIYYWSTTSSGVRRATVSDAAPVDFLTPATVGKCVACHTVSRDGTRIGADIGGDTLGVYNVKDRSTVIAPSTGIKTSWTTFSPDNARIVTASGGVLTLRDGNTGQSLGVVPVGTGLYGTHPDWSPDGKRLVFARSASNKDRGIQGSSIATIEYNAGTWQNLKVLVPSSGSADTNAYPMFSPDSRFIAYVRANGASDKNLKARLYVVATDGSGPAVELAQANTVVSNQTLAGTAADVANNMPTWAPTKTGETMFVAFTSARAYGKVFAFNKYLQMWVAAFDPAKYPAADSSYPAFRLPFQGDTEESHRPFWVEDALAPPPPPAPDGGTMMCLPANADCTSGAPCCSGYICNDVGGKFICDLRVG